MDTMQPYRDGSAIVAPKRAEGPDAIGDGWVRLEPGDPEYDQWDSYLRAHEQSHDPGQPPRPGWVRDLNRRMP